MLATFLEVTQSVVGRMAQLMGPGGQVLHAQGDAMAATILAQERSNTAMTSGRWSLSTWRAARINWASTSTATSGAALNLEATAIPAAAPAQTVGHRPLPFACATHTDP